MKTGPYHHGALREALLARAEQALEEKGPGELSLRELARDLGVSPAAPARHFKTKRALFDALVLDGLDRFWTAMVAAKEDAGESFADRLTALTRAYLQFAAANPALLELMYSTKYDLANSPDLAAAWRRMPTLSIEIIEDGQRRGEVRQGPVEEIHPPLFAAMHGFVTLAVASPFPPGSDQDLKDVVEFMRRGCAPDVNDRR